MDPSQLKLSDQANQWLAGWMHLSNLEVNKETLVATFFEYLSLCVDSYGATYTFAPVASGGTVLKVKRADDHQFAISISKENQKELGPRFVLFSVLLMLEHPPEEHKGCTKVQSIDDPESVDAFQRACDATPKAKA